jgi:acetoin:2,6-dichlorophenolindophenol oxidoreductase subunit alpha
MPPEIKKTAMPAAGSPSVHNGFSLISNDKLIALYANLLKCRMLEESARILLLARNFDSCGHGALGHEASAVGVALDLVPHDILAPSHLDCTTSLLHGVPIEKILARLSGRSSKARPVSLDSAVAAAKSNKNKKNGRIVVAFASEETAAQGAWHLAMHNARRYKLPMIFVSHIHHPAKFESASHHAEVEDVASKIEALHFPVIPVDGNDVVAVYRVASESITHARQRHSATLIECHLWDDDDPILNMEKYLRRKGLFTPKLKHNIAATFTRDLDAALDATAIKNA